METTIMGYVGIVGGICQATSLGSIQQTVKCCLGCNVVHSG